MTYNYTTTINDNMIQFIMVRLFIGIGRKIAMAAGHGHCPLLVAGCRAKYTGNSMQIVNWLIRLQHHPFIHSPFSVIRCYHWLRGQHIAFIRTDGLDAWMKQTTTLL